MRREDREAERQNRVVRLLMEHIQHPGFQPIDSDYTRTIGWKCPCQGDGCELEVPTEWYNETGRWQKGWGRYQAIRYAQAQRLGNEAARRMWSDFAPKKKTPEEEDAEKRAKDLLYRFLSKKQQEQLESLGYFEQLGGDGNTYRLWYGEHRSIELVEDNEVVKALCIHPKIIVPTADTVLAQKLLVQGDIERLYKTANVTPAARRRR